MELKSLAAASVLAVTASLSLGAAPPMDTPIKEDGLTPVLTQSEEDQVRDEYQEYGIPEHTQDELIQKLEQGEPLDSFDGESEPVSNEIIETDEFHRDVSWFEDGSYASVTVEKPSVASDEIGARNVFGCNSVQTSGNWGQWTNCTVEGSWGGSINISFNASWEKSSAYARITWISDLGQQQCLPFSCTRPVVSVVRSEQTATQAAVAQAQTTVTSPVAYQGSWEAWVQLRVNSNGYWTVTS